MMSVLGFIIGLAIVIASSWIWYWVRVRKSGQDLFGGKPTLFDVRRLLLEGKQEAAIRLYSQIFRINRQEAEKGVRELDSSLHHD
ncbi:MAG: hypothetical protein NUV91_06380 [Candidatus Omnitrophica bacterium]|nr:hypothetical protein [Candidatus Omnitrophota bacterium]